jgi:hypothetical protein
MNSPLEADLERACKLLEYAHPGALDESAVILQSVACRLAAQCDAIPVEEALRLRAAARRVRFLLDLAAQFHSRWRDILAAMCGGYTAAGAPVALASRGRISISG